LKRGEKTIADFPATVGVIGILAALASAELAVVAGIGTVAAMANKVTLEIEKEDGHTKVISLDRHREH
jgi:precorrin-2 methylase